MPRTLYRTLRSWAKQPGNRTPENAEQEQKWIDARGELGSFWALGYRWVNYGWILGWLIYEHNFLVNHTFFCKVLLDYGLLTCDWYGIMAIFQGISWASQGSSATSNPMVFFHPIRRSLAVFSMEKPADLASWTQDAFKTLSLPKRGLPFCCSLRWLWTSFFFWWVIDQGGKHRSNTLAKCAHLGSK